MVDPFEGRLHRIEEEIHRCLPERPGPEWLEETAGEEWGRGADLEEIGSLTAPAVNLLKRGGKRWRPLLQALCGELCGDGEAALKLAALVEIPHNGSLIIDDLEDGARERRGGPALHLQYGADLALNAGNLMYFLPAFLIEKSGLAPEIRLRIYRVYTEDLYRLHLGQGLDILWHREHGRIPGVPEYLRMCRLKTGSLARMAARIGVAAAGGGEELARDLGALAADLGVCFQIQDDVANLTTGVKGKMKGDDLVEGKKSLPLILFLQEHPEEAESFCRLFEKLRGEADPERVRSLLEPAAQRLVSSGSTEQAGTRARRLFEKALQTLRKVVPPSEARDLLELLAGRLIL